MSEHIDLNPALRKVLEEIPEGYQVTVIAHPKEMGDILISLASDLEKNDLIAMLQAVAYGLKSGVILPPEQMN